MTYLSSQGNAPKQGRWFIDTCKMAVEMAGFEVDAEYQALDCHVDVSLVITNQECISMYAFCHGSVAGSHPGFLRMDTVKKAISDIQKVHDAGWGPILLMTSHKPKDGRALNWLEWGMTKAPFLLINPLNQGRFLAQLARATEEQLRDIMQNYQPWE